jgi:hypothetical protein
MSRNAHEIAARPLWRRLMEAYEVNERTGCWEWTRARTSWGYGRMSWQNHVERAHRLAAHVWLGFDLTSDLIVMHTCDNPPCVNPDHLRIGSLRDNTHDMHQKGRHRGGGSPHERCRKGHDLTVPNARAHGRCRICRDAYMRAYEQIKPRRER